jgi:hypothetical protein
MSGIDSNDEQLLNIPDIPLALDIFHFDIFGSDFREVHSWNKLPNFNTPFVSHLEISGIDVIKTHSLNIFDKSVTLFIFHFDKSGKVFKDLH